MPLDYLEDAVRHGWRTFKDSKCHIIFCFILNLLSLIAYTVGLGTDWWLKSGSSRMGLWRFCVSSYDSNNYYEHDCCQSADNFITEEDWLNEVRVLFCIGLALGFAAFVTITLKTMVLRLSSKTPLLYICMIFCFLTAISILAGVAVFITRYRSGLSLVDFSPSGSFVTCMISACMFLLSGGLLRHGPKDTNVTPISIGSRQERRPPLRRAAATSPPTTRALPSSELELGAQVVVNHQSVVSKRRIEPSTLRVDLLPGSVSTLELAYL